MKFYFTYSSSGMAYEGGWTEVEAPSIRLTPRKRSKPLSCKYITVSVPMSRLPANWAAVTGRKMLSS